MEIEHINEDTIRVIIETDDLEERGITFLDLINNQKQIENFFYSILEEVDVDEEFQESEAVTFQVMPNNNGLELFISKGANFDNKFLDSLEAEGLIDPSQANEYRSNLNKQNESEEVEIEENGLPNETKHAIIVFGNMEQVILMASEYHMENGASNLYSYQNQYYLHLSFYEDKMQEKTSEEELAYALEFGEQSKVAPEVLDEYAEKIMADNALEQVREYFVK